MVTKRKFSKKRRTLKKIIGGAFLKSEMQLIDESGNKVNKNYEGKKYARHNPTNIVFSTEDVIRDDNSKQLALKPIGYWNDEIKQIIILNIQRTYDGDESQESIINHILKLIEEDKASRKQRTFNISGIEYCQICTISPFIYGKNNIYVHDCGKIFHTECIERWCKEKGECPCPNCRGEIKNL